MAEQSRHNREGGAGGGAQQGGGAFIPRTDRIPVEASHQLAPAQFAAILTQKLEKVKREQELDEKLTKKLSEDCSASMVSQVCGQDLQFMFSINCSL